ncbi:MAG: hypothetical protein R3D02_16540 [Hyphomicrobiales bacterium]
MSTIQLLSAEKGIETLTVPPAYELVSRQTVTVDGEAAELFRHERRDGRNTGLFGEHFSIVRDRSGRLKGFARMDADLAGKDLPSREEARAIALDFLGRFAPDLLQSFKISWIEPHDETVNVAGEGRSEARTITGMKVKMRNTADGRWFWVIVGADRDVMVFERDIVWITIPGRRKTEKWLHDAWLAENER